MVIDFTLRPSASPDKVLNMQDLLAAYLALSAAQQRAFQAAAGLEIRRTSRAHSGHKRTKNPIRRETRLLVLARERWACRWCGTDLSVSGCHLDHIRMPSSPARPGEVARCVVASCPACNVARGGVHRPDVAAELDAWATSPRLELDRAISVSSEGRARSARVAARSNCAIS